MSDCPCCKRSWPDLERDERERFQREGYGRAAARKLAKYSREQRQKAERIVGPLAARHAAIEVTPQGAARLHFFADEVPLEPRAQAVAISTAKPGPFAN